MAVYHFVWDLGFFGFVDPGRLLEAWFKGFGHAIAAAFLTIAGASLALSARGGLDLPAYFRRIALVFAAAMAVTAATAFVFPDSFVAFGVLHCIVAASLFPDAWGLALAGTLALIPVMVSTIRSRATLMAVAVAAVLALVAFKLPYRLSLVIAVTGAMAAGLAADEAAARLQWQRRRAAQPVAEEEDA